MLHLQLSMTDCSFATENLAHIHKKDIDVFFPVNHESLLLNRGVGTRMDGVTFRSSSWDGMEAKHTPCSNHRYFLSPATFTQIFGWFVSGFQKKYHQSPKKHSTWVSSSRIEGSRHGKGSSWCHLFWKLPPLDKLWKNFTVGDVRCWGHQQLWSFRRLANCLSIAPPDECHILATRCIQLQCCDEHSCSVFFVSKNWSWGVIRSWGLKELTSGVHQLGEAKSVNCCVC